MLKHERRAKKDGFSIIIGVDEAGRGPLAGPVVAAAVRLRTFSFKARIDDSKKLTALQRVCAFAEITSKAEFGVGIMNEGIIDSVNIANASNLAAEGAVARLMDCLAKTSFPSAQIAVPAINPENIILLLDGRLKPDLPYNSKEIIGGDGLSMSIAAASIIAKVVRDRLMAVYDDLYPDYGFGIHKGYATRVHRQRLSKFGLSPIHRRSFCRSITVASREQSADYRVQRTEHRIGSLRFRLRLRKTDLK